MERFHYHDDKLKIAESMGYTTVSEALKTEYRKIRSARRVGYLFGMSSNGVRFALHRLGEPLIGRGGHHPAYVKQGPIGVRVPDTTTWTKAPNHRRKR
jgi:hypothetical protein